MVLLIVIFGALTLVAGIVILIKPEVIFGLLRNNLDKLSLHLTAVVIRVLLGVMLILQSALSQFPLTIEILGWLSIAAGVSLAVIGRKNFKRLMSWAFSLLIPYGRIGGVFAAAFGAFLIYAFIN